ncbi:MAG: hypothetical protein IPO04_16435 [Cytophagaceae bacterium]|nr:hypothetical protein [Cytophagaceae bacterium]
MNLSPYKVEAQLLSHSVPQGVGAPLGLGYINLLFVSGCGVIHLNINCGAINASSLVQISMSEYGDVNNPAGSRFVGAARYTAILYQHVMAELLFGQRLVGQPQLNIFQYISVA